MAVDTNTGKPASQDSDDAQVPGVLGHTPVPLRKRQPDVRRDKAVGESRSRSRTRTRSASRPRSANSTMPQVDVAEVRHMPPVGSDKGPTLRVNDKPRRKSGRQNRAVSPDARIDRTMPPGDATGSETTTKRPRLRSARTGEARSDSTTKGPRTTRGARGTSGTASESRFREERPVPRPKTAAPAAVSAARTEEQAAFGEGLIETFPRNEEIRPRHVPEPKAVDEEVGEAEEVEEGEQVYEIEAVDEPDEITEAEGSEEAEEAEERPAIVPPGAGREMLINVSTGDECRIAVLHRARLEELFIERQSAQSHVGNIYKGRVTNLEPSIQAVFVDFGMPKHGFLHISDVQPQYFPDHRGETEDVGRKIPRQNRPPIQKCFHRGQKVIVQVTKEGVGTKGPTLTTYVSIPGRYLVMMPGMSRHGVSRRIEDEAERRSMRDLLSQLELPPGMGFILRTAGLGRNKRELQRDLHYLTRLWRTVADRIKKLPAPAELYRESDLVTRTIRDVYTTEFTRLVVDDAETAKQVRDFLQIVMPRSKADVQLYADREPLFHKFGIEEEIAKINMRHVPLRSGGSLVIDSTEALVAIDVNSGRYRTAEDPEEAAFKINLEAAEEIARQLRLRDLGGLIVCDFIDMRLDRHNRAVERALRDALKRHKERARILRMSAFGLIELTRQRQGPSLKRNIYFDCPHCKGSGLVKMPESVILDVMRIIQLAAHNEQVQRVVVTVATDVAFQILNRKRAVVSQIEAETNSEIIIRGDASFTADQVDYLCTDSRGQPVNVIPSYTHNGADGI